MQFSRLLFLTALVATPIALVGTTWLYLYPLFDQACSFPEPPNSIAPFRLLALGDPQLEGDTSLPKRGAPIFPSLRHIVNDTRNAGSWYRRWYFVKEAGKGLPRDLLKWAEGHRKRIDIWGNDYYIGHIISTLRWWTKPTHVAVLGDLLGSQWIKDEEFERRTRRYWNIVLRGMEKVPESLMGGEEEEGGKRWGGSSEILGEDRSWEKRVINIAGNHDIGYAGDIDEKRVERFEKAFGKVNWEIVFTLPESLRTVSPIDTSSGKGNEQELSADDPPALRLVILNSMNLDTPAYIESLQRDSYDFMNHVISTSRSVTDKTHATILLTHIPFYKEAGLCVDSPLFSFFEGGSGVKEQNMLSDYVSKMLLEGIFGLNSNHEAAGHGFGRRGIVINGHDHAGCDVLHYITQPGVESKCPQNIEPHEIHMPSFTSNTTDALPLSSSSEINTTNQTSPDPPPPSPRPEPPKWQALHFPHLPYKMTQENECIALNHVPHIREVTLRSIMGDFAGYAGFLSAWFDPKVGERGEWRLEFSTCGMGTQHWWWGVYIVNLIWAVALIGGVTAKIVEKRSREEKKGKGKENDPLKREKGDSELATDHR